MSVVLLQMRWLIVFIFGCPSHSWRTNISKSCFWWCVTTLWKWVWWIQRISTWDSHIRLQWMISPVNCGIGSWTSHSRNTSRKSILPSGELVSKGWQRNRRRKKKNISRFCQTRGFIRQVGLLLIWVKGWRKQVIVTSLDTIALLVRRWCVFLTPWPFPSTLMVKFGWQIRPVGLPNHLPLANLEKSILRS